MLRQTALSFTVGIRPSVIRRPAAPVQATRGTHADPYQPYDIPLFPDYASRVILTTPGLFKHENTNYHPIRQLGKGAYGITWLCVSATGEKLVLKCELPYDGSYAEGEAFKREAYFNRFIYGVGEMAGDPEDKSRPHYLLMRYFEGKTQPELFAQFKQYGPRGVSYQEILRLWVLAAAALANLHELGFVHCDFHASNLIYAIDYMRAWAIDFGFMSPINKPRADGDLPPLSQKKYAFRAPETLQGRNGPVILADVSQDFFAAGHLLLQFTELCKKLFTGTPRAPVFNSLDRLVSELKHPAPSKRLTIRAAICRLITDYFHETVRTAPIAEWSIIMMAVIQMRLDRLKIDAARLAVTDNAQKDNEAEHIELTTLISLLPKKQRTPALTTTVLPPNHEVFLSALDASTATNCIFINEVETIRFAQQLMYAFFSNSVVPAASGTAERRLTTRPPHHANNTITRAQTPPRIGTPNLRLLLTQNHHVRPEVNANLPRMIFNYT